MNMFLDLVEENCPLTTFVLTLDSDVKGRTKAAQNFELKF